MYRVRNTLPYPPHILALGELGLKEKDSGMRVEHGDHLGRCVKTRSTRQENALYAAEIRSYNYIKICFFIQTPKSFYLGTLTHPKSLKDLSVMGSISAT